MCRRKFGWLCLNYVNCLRRSGTAELDLNALAYVRVGKVGMVAEFTDWGEKRRTDPSREYQGDLKSEKIWSSTLLF